MLDSIRCIRERGEEFVKNDNEKIYRNPGDIMRAKANEMDFGSIPIVRIIHKDLGLKSHALWKDQLLTEKMKDNRKGKAANLLKNMKHDSCCMLRFFSEEKKFDMEQKFEAVPNMEADAFAVDSNMSTDAAPPYRWSGTLAEWQGQFLNNASDTMELTRESLCVMIFYDYKSNLTSEESHKRLVKDLGDKAPSIRTVFNWFNGFKFGKTNLEDEPCSGRSQKAVTQEKIELVRFLLREDRRIMYQQLIEKCGHWIGRNQHHH
ncbi:hypothetical protein LAZ67_X001197 [Cordylochernes scorpioides]|uniref:Mos1 transposase HTH domain-containing protein n=1 Tax=Cordylochernes scorpioides TaxID=51811 RepID=A0ABY6LUW5_9ARAC|nr:hypothetical protein LAZ67_X001197 [Cordylochernes scorpioides]